MLQGWSDFILEDGLIIQRNYRRFSVRIQSEWKEEVLNDWVMCKKNDDWGDYEPEGKLTRNKVVTHGKK